MRYIFSKEAPVFVEGGACAMAQWPVQVWSKFSCILSALSV